MFGRKSKKAISDLVCRDCCFFLTQAMAPKSPHGLDSEYMLEAMHPRCAKRIRKILPDRLANMDKWSGSLMRMYEKLSEDAKLRRQQTSTETVDTEPAT